MDLAVKIYSFQYPFVVMCRRVYKHSDVAQRTLHESRYGIYSVVSFKLGQFMYLNRNNLLHSTASESNSIFSSRNHLLLSYRRTIHYVYDLMKWKSKCFVCKRQILWT